MPEPSKSVRSRASAVAVITRAAVAIVLVAAAVGVFALLVATRPEPERAARVDAPRIVRVMRAKPTPVARSWEGYGTARAKHAADVAAETWGVIVDRPEGIDPGAWVDAGQLIVALDDREYRSRADRSRQVIAALEAQLAGLDVELESWQESLALADEATALMQREADRAREALTRGAGNEVEIERILRELTRMKRESEQLRQMINLVPARRARLQAELEAERATLRLAELDLSRTRITAPIAGVLQDVFVHEGERIAQGAVVARIVDLRRIEIPVRVAVSAAQFIRPGDAAELFPGGRRPGSTPALNAVVARIAPEADQQTRTLTVFIEAEQQLDADHRPDLLPGQFLMGRVRSSETRETIVVPRGALLGDRVMIVTEEGRASPRDVVISHYLEGAVDAGPPEETQWAALESGVAPGEVVIISNLDELKPGMQVQGVEAGALSDASESGGVPEASRSVPVGGGPPGGRGP